MINNIKFNIAGIQSFGSKNNNSLKEFGNKYGDTFTKSKDTSTMSSNKYEKVNKDFNVQQNLGALSKRIKLMPIMMDSAFDYVCRYLSGKRSRKDFITMYQNTMTSLYKRIEFGDKNEDYKKTYKSEIETLKEISASCEKYADSKSDEKQFDSELENSVDKYVKTEINRNSNFLI